MAQVISYTRLTTSDKLTDRFLTCQAYNPVDPEQAQKGMLFSQIEILNPWFPTSQIGQTVINTLIREYYRGMNTSDLVNFESAVKKVNESLAQIAQNGETEWIGKFSGVLILINGNEAHFAQSGMSHAYLYRGGKINHITEGLDLDEAPHPLKTFSNLTSGTLKEGDKIVVGNASFFNQIRPLELKTLINSFNPTITAIESAKILKSNGAHDANAIFLELTTKEELANIPPEQKIETVYIDQTPTALGASVGHFFSKTLFPKTKRVFSSIAGNTKTGIDKLAPHLKGGLEKSKQSASGMIQNFKTRTPQSEVNEEIGGQITPVESNSISSRKNFLKLKNKLKRQLIQLGIYTRQKSKIILAVLGVVLVVLLLSILFLSYNHKKTDAAKTIDDKAKQISALQTDAATFQVKKDEQSEIKAYQQISTLYNDLKGTKYESELKAVYDKAQKMLAELTKLNTIEPKKSFDLANVVSLQSCLKKTYALQKDGNVQEISTSVNSLGTISNFNPASSTCLTDMEQMVVLEQDKSLSIFDLTTKKQVQQKPKISSLGQIKSFGDNLYQLDVAQNQIWKIVNDNSTYQDPTAFIKSKIVLADTVDFAIDGSIYTINKAGGIARFSRGEKISEFNMKLPGNEQIALWSNIYTSGNSDSLFALTKQGGANRVVEITKSGEFVAQYVLNGSNSSSIIAIDSDNRSISASQDGKVLTYSI